MVGCIAVVPASPSPLLPCRLGLGRGINVKPSDLIPANILKFSHTLKTI